MNKIIIIILFIIIILILFQKIELKIFKNFNLYWYKL